MRFAVCHLPILGLHAAPLCGPAHTMNDEVGTSLDCTTQTRDLPNQRFRADRDDSGLLPIEGTVPSRPAFDDARFVQNRGTIS
jgi:hypothetical protein